MFDSLKKKLSGFFGKEEKEEEKKKEEKPKKETKAKEKSAKALDKSKEKKADAKSKTKAAKADKPAKEKPSKKEKEEAQPSEEPSTQEASEKEVILDEPSEDTPPEKVTKSIVQENQDTKLKSEPSGVISEEPSEDTSKEKKGFFSRFRHKKPSKEEEKEPEQEEKSPSSSKDSKPHTEPSGATSKLEEEETSPQDTKHPSESSGLTSEKEEITSETPKEKSGGFFSRMLSGKSHISQEDFDKIFDELELILLENNVALEVVDKIKENLGKDLVGREIKKGEIENTITQSLKDAISQTLIAPPDLIKSIKDKQGIFTIIFFGINGSGKTTSIAKLAHLLKKNDISCVLAAGDTFRAAAIQQLEEHANRLNVPIVKHDYGADPAAVAFDARAYAKKHGLKCVLVDTAGRMYTKDNLIKQMEKVIRVLQPDLKIFVGESITGNDATQQAKTFNEAIGIDGIILTKADVDDKGGAILSVSQITEKPIYFLGTGQTYDDFTPFNPQEILKKLGLD